MTTETRTLAARRLAVTPPKAQSEVEKLRRTTFAELATRVVQRRVWLQRYEELLDFVPSQGLTLLRDRHYDDAVEYFEAVTPNTQQPPIASWLCGVAYAECGELEKASDKCLLALHQELFDGLDDDQREYGQDCEAAVIWHYGALCHLAQGDYGDFKNFMGLLKIESNPLSQLLFGIQCVLESEEELQPVDTNFTVAGVPASELEFPNFKLSFDPIPLFTDAIRFSEDQSYAHLFRGEAHVLKNEPKVALGDLTTAVEQLPHLAEPWFYRAVCYRLLGEDNLATQDLQKASEITTRLSESASELVATITSKLE